MKFNFKIFILAAVVVIAVFSLFQINSENEAAKIKSQSGEKETYEKGIQKIRLDKDELLEHDKDSPIEDKTKFKGLNYYAIDPEFKVEATLDLLVSNQKIRIQMTGGETVEFEAYANATFELEGKKCALKIYKNEEGGLFLPFREETNKSETYGGGRYLDLNIDEVKDRKILIDFNLCYLPYCAYNHKFTCPVPPAENTLALAVRVGEKL